MIARELLVKLGFDIDSSKLDKFNASIDSTKRKMIATRASIISNFAPEVSAEIKKINAYNRDLKSLSPTERAEVLNLNKIENQAIREVTKTKKAELKEQENLDKEAAQKEKNLQKVKQRDLKNSMASMASIGRKFAIVGASITAGFGLSLRSTLKDAANFKEGKSSSSFDKSQIATVDAFNKALDSTKSTVANLRNSFVIDMLPAIKETLEVFNAWVQKNKVLIQEKLKDIVAGLAGAFKILISVIKPILIAFNSIINRTIGWKNLITAIVTIGLGAWLISAASSVMPLVRAFKVLSSAILTTNPLVLLIVGAFGLLADEILVTLQGGDSFINDFLKSDAWIFCKNYINTIVDSLKDMWQWLIKVKEGMLNFPSNVTTKINGLIDASFPIEEVNRRKFKDSNLKSYTLPKYNPEEVSRVLNSNVTNNARSANISQKNSFNMTVNVPAGTSQEQLFNIEKIVKSQLEKQQEQLLAAIGSY